MKLFVNNGKNRLSRIATLRCSVWTGVPYSFLPVIKAFTDLSHSHPFSQERGFGCNVIGHRQPLRIQGSSVDVKRCPDIACRAKLKIVFKKGCRFAAYTAFSAIKRQRKLFVFVSVGVFHPLSRGASFTATSSSFSGGRRLSGTPDPAEAILSPQLRTPSGNV